MDYRQNAAPLERDRSILVVGLNGRPFGLDRASGEPLSGQRRAGRRCRHQVAR